MKKQLMIALLCSTFLTGVSYAAVEDPMTEEENATAEETQALANCAQGCEFDKLPKIFQKHLIENSGIDVEMLKTYTHKVENGDDYKFIVTTTDPDKKIVKTTTMNSVAKTKTINLIKSESTKCVNGCSFLDLSPEFQYVIKGYHKDEYYISPAYKYYVNASDINENTPIDTSFFIEIKRKTGKSLNVGFSEKSITTIPNEQAKARKELADMGQRGPLTKKEDSTMKDLADIGQRGPRNLNTFTYSELTPELQEDLLNYTKNNKKISDNKNTFEFVTTNTGVEVTVRDASGKKTDTVEIERGNELLIKQAEWLINERKAPRKIANVPNMSPAPTPSYKDIATHPTSTMADAPNPNPGPNTNPEPDSPKSKAQVKMHKNKHHHLPTAKRPMAPHSVAPKAGMSAPMLSKPTKMLDTEENTIISSVGSANAALSE